MNILPHTFNDKRITQLTEDMVIGDHLIPKHYCNATEMCKANGKNLQKYFEFSKTTPYLEALKTLYSKRSPSEGERDIPEFVITIRGGIPELQGTWVHPDVANNLSQWISPDFAAWSSVALTALIRNDYVALTQEAEEAKKKVQKLWQEIRDLGIEERKDACDHAADQYLDTHPDSKTVPFYVFTNFSDTLNVLLTGHPAKYWREKFNLGKSELRDIWGHPHLERIKNVETLASVYMEHDKINPTEAIKKAVAEYRYTVWDEDQLLGKHDRKTYLRNHKRKSLNLNKPSA